VAIDMLTYQHGFTALYRGVHHLACLHCGHRMQVYRQPASERNYPDGVGKHLVRVTKCLNPNCPYLADEHKEQTTMEDTLTATKTDYLAVPTGEYLGEFIDQKTVPPGKYDKEQVELTGEIIAPKAYAGKQRKAWPNKTLSTKAKLRRWAEAIYRREIADGEVIHLDTLLHRPVIFVIVSEMQKGDDGEEYETWKIKDLKPYKKTEPFPVPVADKSTSSANGKSAPAAEEVDEFEIGSKDDPFVDE